MERSRPHGGRWNTAQLLRSIEESQFGEERRPAESGHGRSFVSRLGMSEISCFPSSRSRRTSSRAELLDDSIRRPGSQRRVVAPQPRSDTARLGTLSSRRERGKSQMLPVAGSSSMVIRNNELANFEENEDGRDGRGSDNAEGLSYLNLPDSEALSDSEDQAVDMALMEEPSESERLHAHRSPSLLVTGNSNLTYSKRKNYSSARGSSSSGSTSGVGGKAKLGDHLRSQGGINLRRPSPSSSTSRTFTAVEGLRPQKLRVSRRSVEVSSSSSNSRSTTSDYDGVLSYQPSSLAARRSASYFDTSSDIRNSSRSRYDVNETMPRSMRDTALRLHTGAGEARFGRSSSGRTTSSRIHAPTEELQTSNSSSGHIFTRRNISNCFPALGSSQARRSSSPRQIGGQRSPRRFTSTGAHVSQLPASSSAFSSTSAQPPVSLLAAALEVMPSSSTYQTSGREQLPESFIHGSAPSQELSWPATASGWEYHRPRLMAEGLAKILMALERVESDEELTHEQLLMLEATVLFGGMALHDQHRDWRMDVDNMSYEELLALGESIGNVSTGLSKEQISTKLCNHVFFFDESQGHSLCEELKCSICQEEYNDGDQLSKIDCGHKYHTDCIRQWLGLKNICPICKATALS